MAEKKLYDLIKEDSPDDILAEVRTILTLIDPDFRIGPIEQAFSMIKRLYQGSYPGYQGCNIEYHNLQHILDTFLAMARLTHGAVLAGRKLTERHMVLGVIAVLFHDSGYIQEEQDRFGTGAKHTVNHVQRSIRFIQRHGSEQGLSDNEIQACCQMILCSDLAVDIDNISFLSTPVALLGKMLGAADLLAQMADRNYLEKLLLLYREFKEGHVEGYDDEIDLLRKTIGFYDVIARRIATKLDSVDRYMSYHFSERWNIQDDLYRHAIDNQKDYLQKILQLPGNNPLDHLRRKGIVKGIRSNKIT